MWDPEAGWLVSATSTRKESLPHSFSLSFSQNLLRYFFPVEEMRDGDRKGKEEAEQSVVDSTGHAHQPSQTPIHLSLSAKFISIHIQF